MKKYSADYFEKKFKILWAKLLSKEGFIQAVQELRTNISIPIGGFANESELALFFIKKMTESEIHTIALLTFIDNFEKKNKKRVSEENREDIIESFIKVLRDKNALGGRLLVMYGLEQHIRNHSDLFTSVLLRILTKNKFLTRLSPDVFKLLNKFWGFDLLDEHVAVHFIEKYLFLGDAGFANYIRGKVACSNCRYIGVQHFSPDRNNMAGKDEGAFSKNYVFNKATVKQLSSHFNSVFLIIKPYATKEQVLQYLEDNWNDLKEHVIEKNTFYKQFGAHPSKIKESDTERNNLVYELYKIPKKELARLYKGERNFSLPGVYKETIISSILSDEHGILMTPDAIKKAATRFAKSARILNQPKDIRDI